MLVWFNEGIKEGWVNATRRAREISEEVFELRPKKIYHFLLLILNPKTSCSFIILIVFLRYCVRLVGSSNLASVSTWRGANRPLSPVPNCLVKTHHSLSMLSIHLFFSKFIGSPLSLFLLHLISLFYISWSSAIAQLLSARCSSASTLANFPILARDKTIICWIELGSNPINSVPPRSGQARTDWRF